MSNFIKLSDLETLLVNNKKTNDQVTDPSLYYNSSFNTPGSKNGAYLMNDGTVDTEHHEPWWNFDRFYSVDLCRETLSGRHYIFMCRPDLYLIEEGQNTLTLSKESRVANDPYFNYLAEYYPHIISSLTGDFAGIKTTSNTNMAAATGSGYGNSKQSDGSIIGNGDSRMLTLHGFIPYITSRIESLQLPDYTIKQSNIVQPYTKYSVPYTTTAIESTTGGTFDLTLREDIDYSIHKLFYAWVYYQNNVMRNVFKPKKKYLLYNALDYATSIYDILVDATGENILYWAKYTGCVPTSVPMSDFSFNKGGDVDNKVSIPFAYYYCEQMDRDILVDFQYNSLGYIAMKNYFAGKEFAPGMVETIPIYNADTFLGRNYVGRPVIERNAADPLTGKPTLKLRWMPGI